MSEVTLGKILKEMYQTSPKGFQVANIHLFSIYYADVIERDCLNKKEILQAADMQQSYQTEISKGINLALYVSIKEEQIKRIQQIEAKYN